MTSTASPRPALRPGGAAPSVVGGATQPDGRGRGAAPPGDPAAAGRRRVRAPLAVAGGVAAATVLLALRSPYVTGSYGACPVVGVLGVWCPGCGGLRAVHDLAHLELAHAWAMNPLVVVAVAVSLGAWAVWLRRAWLGRPPRPVATRAGVAVVLAALVFGVVRNVPALAPWLAPEGQLPPFLGG